jgi:transcription termination factor Rho
MDLWQSGTRKEEKLLDPQTLHQVTLVRRSLAGMRPVETMESLIDVLRKHPSNASFLQKVAQFQ